MKVGSFQRVKFLKFHAAVGSFVCLVMVLRIWRGGSRSEWRRKVDGEVKLGSFQWVKFLEVGKRVEVFEWKVDE